MFYYKINFVWNRSALNIKMCYLFCVAIDLKKGEVYRGEPKTKADTTLTIDDKDMIQMVFSFSS